MCLGYVGTDRTTYRTRSGADFFRSGIGCVLRSPVFPEGQTFKPMLMMNGMIVFLIAMIVLMVFLVIDSDKKNTKLVAENYRLKGQVDVLEQRPASAGVPVSEGEPLTTEKVEGSPAIDPFQLADKKDKIILS